MNFQQLNLTNLDYSLSSTDIIINNFSSNLNNSQKQLIVLLKALKQQTFDLINSRYQDFIALSSSLDGCDVLLESLKNDLQLGLLESEIEKLSSASTQINTVLAKKHELAKMNSICVQLDMIDTLFKKLNNDIAVLDSEDIIVDISVLIKLSREIGYIYSAINPFSSHSYIKKITPKLEAIKNLVLQKTLTGLKKDNLSNSFQVLSDLDSIPRGIAFIQKNIIHGFLGQLDSTKIEFDQVLEEILEWIEVEILKISHMVDNYFDIADLVFGNVMDFLVLG
jgi:hypothetical protein